MKINIYFPRGKYLLSDIIPGEIVEINECLYLVSNVKTQKMIGCISIIDGKYVDFESCIIIRLVDVEFNVDKRENNNIEYSVKDVHPGCVINFEDNFYIITDNVKYEFIGIVRLTNGYNEKIRKNTKVIVVNGEFVVKA